MKTSFKAVMLISVCGILMISGGLFIQNKQDKYEAKKEIKENIIVKSSSKMAYNEEEVESEQPVEQQEVIESKMPIATAATSIVIEEPIVYDNMTMKELSEKLDRSLNSTLAGKGNMFAERSIALGIDPYMALAIVLHETGCKWECSTLVKQCNNIGGQKGGPTCGNGSYKAFNTLDEGINGFFDNLYNNYYAKGLTTPEAINPKYAASTTWTTKIYKYMEEIKAK